MFGGEILERFIDDAPVCVMVRATLENLFAPDALDDLFARQAEQQYERELLFSSVVDLMSLVVCRVHPSIHAAYRRKRESIPVSVKSLYNKLSGIEPRVCRALVRHTAQVAGEVIHRWKHRTPLLKGHRVKVVDGNHLAGTDHRLGVLREEGAAALPGVVVVVLDPDRGLIDDIVVAEDAYTQELKLFEPILRQVEQRDVIIADRHYCTSDILFGVNDRRGFFVIRQHLGHLSWQLKGRRSYQGRTETGTLYEQEMELTHPDTGETLSARRITVELDQPAREGDEALHVLTNLPPRTADAERVAVLYRGRWKVETAFQHIATSLSCELTTLGYPPAALFSFSMAVACFNVFAVILAVLENVHGQETVQENVSLYSLAEELSGTYRGMMIALPPDQWECFQTFSAAQLASQLKCWARRIDLSRYQKFPRGLKTRAKRPYAPTKHVSTARLLKKHKPPS